MCAFSNNILYTFILIIIFVMGIFRKFKFKNTLLFFFLHFVCSSNVFIVYLNTSCFYKKNNAIGEAQAIGDHTCCFLIIFSAVMNIESSFSGCNTRWDGIIHFKPFYNIWTHLDTFGHTLIALKKMNSMVAIGNRIIVIFLPKTDFNLCFEFRFIFWQHITCIFYKLRKSHLSLKLTEFKLNLSTANSLNNSKKNIAQNNLPAQNIKW